jgi:hypothetical protein
VSGAFSAGTTYAQYPADSCPAIDERKDYYGSYYERDFVGCVCEGRSLRRSCSGNGHRCSILTSPIASKESDERDGVADDADDTCPQPKLLNPIHTSSPLIADLFNLLIRSNGTSVS